MGNVRLMLLWKTVESGSGLYLIANFALQSDLRDGDTGIDPKPSPASSSSLYGLRGGPSVRFMRRSRSQFANPTFRPLQSSIIAYSFQHVTPSVNDLQELSITYTYSQQLSPIMAG